MNRGESCKEMDTEHLEEWLARFLSGDHRARSLYGVIVSLLLYNRREMDNPLIDLDGGLWSSDKVMGDLTDVLRTIRCCMVVKRANGAPMVERLV